jgi:hypothetical protein
VGLNGLKDWTDAPLPTVSVFAVVAVLVSMNLFDVQVSKDCPDVDVESGVVVLNVVSAVPLIIEALLT